MPSSCVKCFYMVKWFWKSVQYIWRYLTKLRQFFGHVVTDVHKWAKSTLWITGPNFMKFSHNMEASFTLLTRILRLWYPILFCNARAISAGGYVILPSEWKRRSDWSSAIQYLPYGAKIVKIGPEILRLRANKSATTQNWLPWQRPLRNWNKMDRIDNIHTNTFHLVKRSWKSVQ